MIFDENSSSIKLLNFFLGLLSNDSFDIVSNFRSSVVLLSILTNSLASPLELMGIRYTSTETITSHE
jgi:hypothetical protein